MGILSGDLNLCRMEQQGSEERGKAAWGEEGWKFLEGMR